MIIIVLAVLATVGSRANTLPYTAPPPQPSPDLYAHSVTDPNYGIGGGTLSYMQLAPTNIIGFGTPFRVTVYSINNFDIPQGPTFSLREPDLQGTGTGGYISTMSDPPQDLVVLQLYPPETSQTYDTAWILNWQWDVTYLAGVPQPGYIETIYTKQYSLAQVPDQYANRWLIIRINTGSPTAEYPVAFLKNVPLQAWITESPSNVNVGDTFTLQLTTTNVGTNTYTMVMPYPLKVEGTNKITALDGPSPASVASLGPGEGQTFTYHYQAVSNGPVRFTAQVKGTDPSGSLIYSEPQSVTVPIGGYGDLLIRDYVYYAEPPHTDFQGNDIYSTDPTVQSDEVTTTAGQPARFQIEVQNDTSQTRSFVLKAVQNNLPGWTTTYQFSGADISAALTNASGYSIGPLAPGDSRIFDVVETPDATAAEDSTEQSTFYLYGSAGDTVPMDTAGATGLNLPIKLYASLNAPTNVNPGDTFTVTMGITNYSDTITCQSVTPQGDSLYAYPSPPMSVSGSGTLKLLSGPSPQNAVTLNPGEGCAFTYQYQATAPGTVTLSGRAYAICMKPNTVIGGWHETPEAECRLSIGGQGDLLIKQADEPDSAYRGKGELQAAPVGDQVLEQYVTNGTPANFQVRLDNAGATNRSFVLRLAQPGQSNVTATCTAGGTDITGALRSASGYNTGTIPAGGSLTVDVELDPTVSVTNIQGGVILTVYGDSSGLVPYDAVEAEVQTADIIVVNSTGDQPAANPSDSPDVDLSTPGLQVTLRSAIQYANQRSGKDIIHFNINSSGTPVIQPATALPEITDPVVIDGYSQDPSSLTPPVVLNGHKLDIRNVSALVVSGGDSVIRGLVVQDFPIVLGTESHVNGAIVLKGVGGNRIEDCFVGTDKEGTRGDAIWGYGILITNSPGNIVQGCLVSGCAFGGVIVSGSASIGNQITGNRIGTDVTGTFSYNPWSGPGANDYLYPSDNLGIGVRPDQVIGGSFLDMLELGAVWIGNASSTRIVGNIIAGNNCWGVNIVGTAATGNVVQGNQLGYQPPNGNKTLRNNGDVALGGGASDNLIGGSGPGEGNQMGGSAFAVFIDNPGTDRNRLQGNVINGDVYLRDGADNDIGGDAPGEGNTLGDCTITVYRGKDNHIYGNQFGVGADGATNEGSWWGVEVDADTASSGQVQIGGDGAGQGNVFEKEAVGDVLIGPNSSGIPVLDNTFSSYTKKIDLLGPGDPQMNSAQLGGTAPKVNDDGDADEGGNHLQNYPLLKFATASAADVTTIRGALETTSHYTATPYRLDFYQDILGNPVGTGTTMIGASGYQVFTNDLSVFVPAGYYIVATATAPDGSTSETSPPILVQGPSQTDSDGISDNIEQGVPSRTPNSQNTSTPMSYSGVTSYNSAGQNGSSQIIAANSTASPAFQAVTLTNGALTLTWSAVSGQQYQLQYNSDLGTTNWINLTNTLTATSTNLSVSDVIGTNQQRFYRVIPLNTSSSTGDGNGDGIPDYLQNDVASFPMPNGDYVTLAALGYAFTNVVPGATPPTTNAPALNFPLGFVSFEVTGVATGAVADVTCWLPSGVTVDSWWNYDPTNGWNDFTYNGTTGAEIGSNSIVLHFQDGGRGDLDGVANGVIEAYGGPGVAWGPVPMLQISQPTSDEKAMGAVAHVSWPVTGVGAYLEGSPDLSSGSWHAVSDLPVFDNGNAEVNVTATNTTYFWRLHRSQ